MSTRVEQASDGSCLVLGYDRSDGALAAFRWATGHLQAAGRLIIVHACRALHAPPSPLATPDKRHARGAAMLDELLMEDTAVLLDLAIETEISDQDPVAALIDAAGRHGAEAIVVGHVRHAPLRRALCTVTGTLLDESPVPVIAVPASAAAKPAPALA